MREIELKFELSEADAARLARSRVFGEARPRSRRLHAIYFDTPDHRLAAQGMALRVRDEDGQWIQCVKAGHSGEAGLHAREEWEHPRPDRSLDLTLLRGTPVAGALTAARSKLAPVFEVDMERITWLLPVGPHARVEVALDRGIVRRARRQARVCELELGSIDGDPLAVFEAAERLLGEVPLRPCTTTKAQRGYALSRPVRASPVKAAAVTLTEGASAEAAARSVIAAALAQLQGNEALAAAPGADPEYLHQFRVGLRRMRAALRIFGDVFTPEDARRIRADCRWLSRSTGAARDWDVFTSETLPALLEGSVARRRAVVARAAKARDAARKHVREAIESPRYARFVLRFARWLAMVQQGEHDLSSLARGTLQGQHRKATHGLRKLAAMGPGQRHRVRIRLKRLRYACEALAGVFGRERGHPYVKALARLQDDLGRAVDARMAMPLVEALRLPATAASTARARLRAAEAEALREIAVHAQALETAERFWRGKGR